VKAVAMGSPADQVNLPTVTVELPAQSELKLKTACLCVHCGVWLPDDKMKMASCAGKVGFLFMQSASSCKFVQHKTCMSSIGKGYMFDLEKDYCGKDGWVYNQSQASGAVSARAARIREGGPGGEGSGLARSRRGSRV